MTGYSLLGGDFFPKKNAFTEQMTIWRTIKDKKTGDQYFQPKRHDPARQVWRDFSSLVVQKNDQHNPGVVGWLTLLKERDILPPEEMIQLNITSVQYGDKDFFITDEFGDSLSFGAVLLTEKGKIWQELVLNEIERCEKAAYYVGLLARNLVRAAGGGGGEEDSQCERAKEKFFYRLDLPFRDWLSSLEPWQQAEARYEKREEWNKVVVITAGKLGREMAEEAGPKAFIGRKDENTGNYYSASAALNWFNYQITKMEKEG